jgi:hypothetical protein
MKRLLPAEPWGLPALVTMLKPSGIACTANLFVGGAIWLFLAMGIVVGNPVLFTAIATSRSPWLALLAVVACASEPIAVGYSITGFIFRRGESKS